MRNRRLLLVYLAVLIPALQGCIPGLIDDRRTSATQIEDSGIERKIGNRIEEKFGTEVHYDVVSFNRYVVLMGEAPTQQAKDDIGALALGVQNVRNVQNEMVVGPATSSATRANDAYLTSKVKTRLATASKVSPARIKVVTEDSAVFLMGLVTHKEADEAAEIASTTGGVRKVVKVFEYTD
jgi:osmotically-inducible protein OsmY